MANAVGLSLLATTISFSTEWVHTDVPNFRIVTAGLGVAVLCSALDALSPGAGKGLATIVLITVMFTPFNGDSPAQTINHLLAGDDVTKKVGGK